MCQTSESIPPNSAMSEAIKSVLYRLESLLAAASVFALLVFSRRTMPVCVIGETAGLSA